MVDRTAASFIPQNSLNQRKSVCPAVCANGRFKVGSRGPGACPINITSLTTAPPDTGVEPGAQHVDLKRAVSQTLASASKDGEEQTQHDTDDDAGDDWEIEHRMLAFDANVAR